MVFADRNRRATFRRSRLATHTSVLPLLPGNGLRTLPKFVYRRVNDRYRGYALVLRGCVTTPRSRTKVVEATKDGPAPNPRFTPWLEPEKVKLSVARIL